MGMFDRNDEKNRRGITATLGRLGRGAAIAVVLALGVGATGLALAHGPDRERGAKWEKFQNMSEEERLQKMQERIDRRMDHMTEKLELTDAQQSKIRKLVTEGHERAMEVLEDAEEAKNRGQVRRQLHQIRKETREEVRAVLTDKQEAKAREARAERRRKRPERIMERLDARLNLDAEQEEQVEAILSEAQTDIQNLRAEEKAGSKGKAKARSGHRDQRKQVGKVMRGAADDIESVLNEEQAAEFQQMRAEFEEHRKRHGNKRGKRGGGPDGKRSPQK